MSSMPWGYSGVVGWWGGQSGFTYSRLSSFRQRCRIMADYNRDVPIPVGPPS